jgi:tetratricopeptide (TPR) repeat protein
MQLEVWKSQKSCLRASVFTILGLVLLVGFGLAVGAPNARAQVSEVANGSGEISGTVLLDADKRPASQVAVSLRSRVTGIFRSVLTDFEGHFRVQNLPRGEYDIAVEEEGYEATQASTEIDGTSSNLVLYLKSKTRDVRREDYTVSVRELKIPGKARSEFQKGLERLAKNDAAGGLSHFTKATQVFPGYFEAYYNIGAADLMLGRQDDAASAFQSAIDLSGGRYAPAHFALGFIACREGRAAEAEKIVRRGLETDDTGALGHVILSQVLLRLHRLDEAEKSAKAALLRDPNSAGAFAVLADVHAGMHNYRAEIEDLDHYLKLLPSGPTSEQVREVREEAEKLLAESQPQN